MKQTIESLNGNAKLQLDIDNEIIFVNQWIDGGWKRVLNVFKDGNGYIKNEV